MNRLSSLLVAAAVLGSVPLLWDNTQARATDIVGVQMASMDQPRVSVMLRRSSNGAPLKAKTGADAGLAKMLGIDAGPDQTATFAAYLDTGASGISISKTTADSMGIGVLTAGARPQSPRILFHDVGVGGTDEFHVSEPLHLSWGAYQALGGSEAEGAFRAMGGPWNCQIGPLSGGGLLESMVGSIDVVGMPAMMNKVVVIDPRAVNTFSDVMKVQILDADSRTKAKVPATNRHVQLSYDDFGPFTFTTPANATRPVIAPNPFIGPGPVTRGNTPAIVVRHGGKSSSGGWLLDTGAAASMISVKQAAALGVTYKPGTRVLEGVPIQKQFTLTIGGIGGQKKAAGFMIDEMHVPTREGDDLIYRNVPILVNDISVEHPTTKQKVTLDGVFGMNLLVASAAISEGLAPDIGQMAEGPYDLIVIDHVNKLLGLQLRK
jgi:hypothetical protein